MLNNPLNLLVAVGAAICAILASERALADGACCWPDGSCSVVILPDDCWGQGGEYQGDGTDCATACSGACCAADHTCSTTTRMACVATNAVYLGTGSDCTGAPCAGIGCDVGVIGQVADAENLATDDFVDILSSQITQTGTSVTFLIETRGNIPTTLPLPDDTITYIWLVDADLDPTTGQPNGVGSEFNVRAVIGDTFGGGFVDVTGGLPGGGGGTVLVQNNQVSITVDLTQIGWPAQFNWNCGADAELNGTCCTGNGDPVPIASAVVCGPPPTGACCLPTMTCADSLTQVDCENQAGIWVGPDSVCHGFVCEPIEWPVAEGGNGNYYMMVTAYRGISWPASDTAASGWSHQGITGRLATSTSQQENDWLTSTFLPFGDWLWLGGFQQNPAAAPDQTWAWVNGEAWSYTNWAPGEPNDDRGSEFYLHIWPDGAWNDHSDAPLRGYIVEFAPGEPVPTVSTWGMVVMTLLVLAAGTVVMGRRRVAVGNQLSH